MLEMSATSCETTTPFLTQQLNDPRSSQRLLIYVELTSSQGKVRTSGSGEHTYFVLFTQTTTCVYPLSHKYLFINSARTYCDPTCGKSNGHVIEIEDGYRAEFCTRVLF